MATRVLSLAACLTAASAQWQIIAPNVGTIATGVAFVDANVGYIPIDANGVGTSIQKSTDGGVTWTDDETSAPFSLLLLDIAANNNNVAVIGALSLEYSLDGAQTFNSSLAPVAVGQCIRSIGADVGFAAVGTFGLLSESNGVAVSYDFGITYKAINISVLTAETRYGAFPSADAWYVSAGDWPGEGSDDGPPCDDPPCQRATVPSGKVYEKLVDPSNYYPVPPKGTRLVNKMSSRIHLLREPSGKTKYAAVAKGRLHASNHPSRKLQPVDTWEAQIATTKDAGKSWNLSFSKIGQFYFNGVECSHTDSCCAVAEAQDNTTSAGTYVWCTTDGGATWVDNFWDKDPNSSLLDIAAVGPNEFWAVGGELGEITVQYPTFYHTIDGGVTWTKAGNLPSDMLFQYAIAIDCAAGNCWALLLDILTQESSLASLKK